MSLLLLLLLQLTSPNGAIRATPLKLSRVPANEERHRHTLFELEAATSFHEGTKLASSQGAHGRGRGRGRGEGREGGGRERKCFIQQVDESGVQSA